MGMALWRIDGKTLCHPLVTQQVEILPIEGDMKLRIRPTSRDPQVEIDPFLPLEISGLGAFETSARSTVAEGQTIPSPFETTTFERVCRLAAEHLDTEGAYLEKDVDFDGGSFPSPKPELQVTNTWVIFARRRSTSFLVDDLRRLAAKIAEHGVPPGAAAHLVEDPSEEVFEPPETYFRGLSTAGATFDGEAEELYFPKPFNDEQVEIIRRLGTQPGLVVQGPPGTGKTHTIANIVCHYLAKGKRVFP